MAATAITKTVLAFNTFGAVPATAAIDATDGALVTYDKTDHKILLIIENVHATVAKTVTINKGNGLQGVADLAIEIPALSKKCVVLESMKFVNMSGDNKGKVLIKGTDVNIQVSAIVLP